MTQRFNLIWRTVLRATVGCLMLAGLATAAEAAQSLVTIVPAQFTPNFQFSLTSETFQNTTCTGPHSFSQGVVPSQSVTFELLPGTSMLFSVDATAVNGGQAGLTHFSAWTSSAPFTPLNPSRTICVVSAPGTSVYVAHYEAPRAVTTAPTCNAMSFSEFASSPVNVANYPGGITVADVDNDGHPDLVFANVDNDTVDIRFGDGHGGFSPPLVVSLPNPHPGNNIWPLSPKVADLNGDGLPDLLWAGENVDAMGVRLAQASGGFATGSSFSMTIGTAVGPQNMVLGDLNHDGFLDVVTADRVNASGIVIRLGNGTGGFGGIGGKFVQFAEDFTMLDLGDVNNDGNLDVVAFSTTSPAHNFGSGFATYLGSGTGTIGNEVFTPASDASGPFALGDVDGDGRADLIYISGGNVRVRLSNGDGSFSNVALSLPTVGGGEVHVLDINGDGHLDIVTGGGGIDVFLGDGHGGFTGPTTIPLNFGTVGVPALAFGDIDGDGRIDIIASEYDFGNFIGYVQVFQNTCSANLPPTVTPATITRQAGSTPTFSTIGTATDDATPAGSLTPTANAIATGLSVTNIANVNGTFSALVGATCSATPGAQTFALTVTDGGGLSTAQNVLVNVTPDTAPTLGAYADLTLAQGVTGTNAPGTAPADNGSVDSIGAFATGFTGTLLADLNSGAVTVVNPGPVGVYTVTVQAVDNCGSIATRTFTLTVRGTANITVSNQNVVFDGNPHFVTVATQPSGLSTVVRYSQSGNPVATPTGAGSYDVDVTLNEALYDAPAVHTTLTVAKAPATIALGALAFTYDGSPKGTTAATTPADLTGVTIGYSQNGSPVAAPTSAGSYDVRASLSNLNYSAPDAIGTLTIAKAVATFTFSNLSYVYDGTPKAATVTTTPAGLTGMTVSYALNGSPVTAPVNAGSYDVHAVLTNANYDAPAVTSTAVLTIGRAAPAVTVQGGTFTFDGAAHPASASAFGVNHEPLAPVVLTYNGSAAAPMATGSYNVLASFPGNGNYTGASASSTIVINRAVPILTWATPAAIAFGTPLGAVQLDAVSSVPGTFTFAPPAGTVLAPGVTTLTATFTPADAVDYAPGQVTTSITVMSQRQTKQQLLATLRTLRSGVTDRYVQRELEDAIDFVTQSLSSNLWAADGIHLNARHGDRVFDLERQAADELSEVIQSRRGGIPVATIQTLVAGFAGVDRQLAATAIADAGSRGIGDARQDLVEGDADFGLGRVDAAFEHYLDAWQDAQPHDDRDDHDDRDHHSHDHDCDHRGGSDHR